MKRWLIALGLTVVLGTAPVLAQEAEEDEEAEPVWRGSLGLAFISTSGNTDTETMGLDFLLERQPTPWGFKLYGNFNRAEEDGLKTAERYLAGARALRAFGDRWELFGGVRAERDKFAGYDLLSMVEGGVVYKALVGPSHLLSFDAGLAYTDEDRVDLEPDVEYLGGVAGLSYEWKISDTASLTQRLIFFPNFDDTDNWRLASDTGLQAAISSWLAVKLGYELRYRNQPIGDNDDTDTTTKVSLVMNF